MLFYRMDGHSTRNAGAGTGYNSIICWKDMMKKFCLLSGILMSAVVFAGSGIDVRQLSHDSYQLTYRSDRMLSVDDAQLALYQPAVEVCAGREPVYGRYKYRKSGYVSSRFSGKNELFIFVQEIGCPMVR